MTMEECCYCDEEGENLELVPFHNVLRCHPDCFSELCCQCDKPMSFDEVGQFCGNDTYVCATCTG